MVDRQAIYKSLILNRIGDFATPCLSCQGLGVKVYGSTATWRGGIGGSALTDDVCDHCWGSGDNERPWPSHRVFYSMKHRIEGLEK